MLRSLCDEVESSTGQGKVPSSPLPLDQSS